MAALFGYRQTLTEIRKEHSIPFETTRSGVARVTPATTTAKSRQSIASTDCNEAMETPSRLLLSPTTPTKRPIGSSDPEDPHGRPPKQRKGSSVVDLSLSSSLLGAGTGPAASFGQSPPGSSLGGPSPSISTAQSFPGPVAVNLHEGLEILSSGSIQTSNGITLMPNGSVQLPNSTLVQLDGTVCLPNGARVTPDGWFFSFDSSILVADGMILTKNNTRIKVDPDGTCHQVLQLDDVAQ
jgi:hypothetical protein